MMNYEVIYEIEKFQFPTELILFIILFFCSTGLLFAHILDIIEGNRKVIKFLFVIILTLSSIVTGIFALSTLTYSGGDKAYCAKLYYDGKYSVVEGVVYDLEEDIKTQMYYVDGECFLVGPNEDTLWDIKENGQQVRISYIPSEDNYIVKLEIA